MGKADEKSGQSHPADSDGDDDSRPDPVGEPPGRKLADSVSEVEGRDNPAGKGVVQRVIGADQGQEGDGESGQKMVDEMRHHKAGEKTDGSQLSTPHF